MPNIYSSVDESIYRTLPPSSPPLSSYLSSSTVSPSLPFTSQPTHSNMPHATSPNLNLSLNSTPGLNSTLAVLTHLYRRRFDVGMIS